MEINQNNKPVTVTFSDGTVKQVIYDSIEFLEGGNVSLRGHLSDLPTETVVETPKEAPVTPQLPPERPYMRRYTFRSGLVRFLHEGRMRTAAVTHCTDKAWRVMNKELGVAWLPKMSSGGVKSLSSSVSSMRRMSWTSRLMSNRVWMNIRPYSTLRI